MKVLYRSIWAKCFLPCLGLALGLLPALPEAAKNSRPNILFCISDDQSYAHTGANGDANRRTDSRTDGWAYGGPDACSY